MHTLKIAVVIMGVMLIVGFVSLVAVIAQRLSHPPPAGATQSTQTAQLFTAPPLDLPAGARIETMSVGADRLVLNLALPDGNRQLLILDLTTGRRLGTIPLRLAP